MAIKIAINGFGRIGRAVFREALNNSNLEVVAINDLTDNATLAHLLKYDSIYGRYDKEISSNEESIIVDKNKFKIFSERDPEKLPWKDLKVDIVLECTGIFRDIEGASKHLKAGAKKVIISAPAKEDSIPGYVLGVNADQIDMNQDIMDMGSCTTNCLAPIAKVLNDNFKIKKGFMTTIHSYTNDQIILDSPHSDLRRARAAALNSIPTSTGAAKAIGKIMPELKGKLDGISIRIPTPTVSILDLVVEVEKNTTVEEVNKAFEKAKLKGILKVEKEPLVSSDFIGDSHSAIVDIEQTMVKDNLVKVLGWYDNEHGYSCRLVEFAEFVGKRL
jgi:glyceraldehyde 3-phosphate dehydrogenase